MTTEIRELEEGKDTPSSQNRQSRPDETPRRDELFARIRNETSRTRHSDRTSTESYMVKSDGFRQRLATEQADGWRITESGDDWAQLHKPNFGSREGHLLIALLTGWWTLGAVNLGYAAFMYCFDSPTKIVEATDATGTSTPLTTDDLLTILRERYARGEIDETEFEQRVERLLATDTIEQARDHRDQVRSERSECVSDESA